MAHETNALAEAASAYLRSAMRQPIRWREWGEEAFDAAKRENKPILLDIGAVWCHWCHVMDRESYDNPDLARLINEKFVAVKVDRDERPDVDSRYQAAVSAISGQGGWPLTVFLTPDGKPFYGGTYFPPNDHYGRPSFRRVLQTIAQAYAEKQSDVLESADNVMSAISAAETFAGRAGTVSPSIIDNIIESALSLFDPQNGGFGQSPKFPHPAAIDLIIDRYARTGDERLKQVVCTTLEKMARGGVYDQLAGGFHRYSVDEHWRVPHFEKMSYDNSELLKNYVHAFQATGHQHFAEVARDIIRWMDEWLSDRERGGFYASQDADYSMDDDGDYFTWALDEARAVLSEKELEVAALHFDIQEAGQMHHNPAKNVLHQRAPLGDIAKRMGTDIDHVRALLNSAKQKMYAARLRRPTPYVDKTVYVGWNAMCVSAYLQAARVLRLDDTKHFALRSLDRILAEAWCPEDGLYHVIAYSDPEARKREVAGLLDDYAFTTLACLDAYESTADLSYFNFARRIGDAMIDRFYDPVDGGFFDRETRQSANGDGALGALAARRKPFQDAPTPAGNSAAAIALLRLHAYMNEAAYHQKAQQTLQVFAGLAPRYGMFASTYGLALVWFTSPHTQVVVIGNDERAERLWETAVSSFAVNKAVLHLTDNEALPQYLPPAIAETIPQLPAVKEGKSVAVVCSAFACQPPVSEPQDLDQMLRAVLPRAS